MTVRKEKMGIISFCLSNFVWWFKVRRNQTNEKKVGRLVVGQFEKTKVIVNFVVMLVFVLLEVVDVGRWKRIQTTFCLLMNCGNNRFFFLFI